MAGSGQLYQKKVVDIVPGFYAYCSVVGETNCGHGEIIREL